MMVKEWLYFWLQESNGAHFGYILCSLYVDYGRVTMAIVDTTICVIQYDAHSNLDHSSPRSIVDLCLISFDI